MSEDNENETAKAEYKKLIGSLGGHKSYLSKVANNIGPYLLGDDLSGERREEAEQLRDRVNERLVKLNDLIDQLIENPITTDDDLSNFEQYTLEISNKVARLSHKLKIQSPLPSSKSPEPTARSCVESAVRYPELSLPTFAGGQNGSRDFRPFYQLFKELVEDRSDISGVYKVQYLRASLVEGSEARQLISHIPPLAENYDLMMTLLHSRYSSTTGDANR